jgi:hypothetical protein
MYILSLYIHACNSNESFTLVPVPICNQKRKGTLGKRSWNAAELKEQDEETFKRKEANAEALIKTHQNKV